MKTARKGEKVHTLSVPCSDFHVFLQHAVGKGAVGERQPGSALELGRFTARGWRLVVRQRRGLDAGNKERLMGEMATAFVCFGGTC